MILVFNSKQNFALLEPKRLQDFLRMTTSIKIKKEHSQITPIIMSTTLG